MLASHYSEIDTRWPYEYGILNFARRWPRTWSTANEQRKQVRCLQKVTRWHPNHTWRQHEDVNFYSSLYPQNTRRPHDGYTTSYWEYDAFELDHEGVTWPPDGIKLSAVRGKFSCWSEIIGTFPLYFRSSSTLTCHPRQGEAEGRGSWLVNTELILVLVLQVHQVVVGGWISQSDEIVKDHKSWDDFSACLWPRVHGPQQNSELVSQNTKGILHYTPGSGESVVKYSLMVLHVSDGKRVHQTLVDPKSIVPYYVVWDRNASPGRGRLNMVFGFSRPFFSSDPL